MPSGWTASEGPVAVVLAAGASVRMGRPKALLPGPRGTFLRTILEVLREAGVEHARVVVAPPHGEDIVSAEPPRSLPLTPEMVVNPAPEGGMLTSIQAGIEGLVAQGAPAVLVWPVDHPLVQPATVCLLVEGLSTGAPVVLPVYRGFRGHPVLFAGSVLGELLTASLEIGARQVVRHHRDRLLEVSVDDVGVVRGIDRPSDLVRYLDRPDDPPSRRP